MFLACQHGDYAIAKKLLYTGINVEIKGKGGDSRLIRASQYGNLDIVKLLITHGADVHASDKDDCTALMVASYKNHLPMVKALLSAGAENRKESLDFVRNEAYLLTSEQKNLLNQNHLN